MFLYISAYFGKVTRLVVDLVVGMLGSGDSGGVVSTSKRSVCYNPNPAAAARQSERFAVIKCDVFNTCKRQTRPGLIFLLSV